MRRSKHFKIENLERRVLLSSAIAAFGMQQTFGIGAAPDAVALADVNLDGKPDLIIGNQPGSVGVLLGDGNGTFQPQQTFAGGGDSVVAADVNADGKPDLVVVSGGAPYSVGVLLGNGNGTFQNPLTYATGTRPTFAAVSDVNSDGKLDVVVANSGDGSVGLFLGNGNGTLQPQQTFAVGANPFSLALADVNRDGKPDIVAANWGNNSASVLLGNGDGTFQPQQTFSTGAGPESLAITDVNGDGKLDLVTANRTSNTVSVLLGNGNGSFQSPTDFAAGSQPWSVTTADVNVDGKPDLIVADRGSNVLSVLLGNGDGTFQAQQTFAAGTNPQYLAAADVNADARPDLIVANTGSNTASVLLGDVPPTVLSINRTNPPGPIVSNVTSVNYTVTLNEPVTGVDPTDFALAMTGGVTATTPVVVMPVNGSVYSVTINGITGTGTLGLNLVDDGSIKDAAGNPLQPGGVEAFQPQQTLAVGAHPFSVAVADLNGDGKPDIVTVNNYPGNVVNILLGNGNGTFQARQTLAPGMNPLSIVVADVNGDGKPDLLIANANSSSVGVFLGNGNGTFQPQQTFATSPNPYSIAVSDLNGDGKPDLVIGNGNFGGIDFYTTALSVLLGNGDGTFQAQRTLVTGSRPRSIAVADVNGDGVPDIVATSDSHGSSLSLLLGNGNGTFQSVRTFALGQIIVGVPSVAVADVNGDGRPDLVASNPSQPWISVLLGNGNGSFQAQRTFATVFHAHLAALADVNGDGKPDIVLATDFYHFCSVAVLLGNGNGTFQSEQTFAPATPQAAYSAAVGDVNGDGRLDVVFVSPDGNSLGVLLATTDGSCFGQVYNIVPLSDTATLGAGDGGITLTLDPDQQHVDWRVGSSTSQMFISDPSGLTINGNGGNDLIVLDYTSGSPLPNAIHLNGTFTIYDLSGTNPLANTTLEIGRSTVYISYASPASDPIAAIKQYLQNGYNNGAWNGIPAASPAFPGDITSLPAAQNAARTTGIGYADSADGLIAGQPANTIELKYTLYGDTTLASTVGFNDFTRMTQHWNQTTGGTWDTGDFNYDGSVNSADFTLMTRTYNTSLGNQAAPAVSAASASNSSPVRQTAKHHRRYRRRPAVGKEKD